jgi:hypothetical protein
VRAVTQVADRSVGPYFTWAWTNKHIVFFDSVGDENYRAYSVVIDGERLSQLRLSCKWRPHELSHGRRRHCRAATPGTSPCSPASSSSSAKSSKPG